MHAAYTHRHGHTFWRRTQLGSLFGPYLKDTLTLSVRMSFLHGGVRGAKQRGKPGFINEFLSKI
jgi:hypothetical protein